MRRTPPSPREWQLFRRLQAGGCPVDTAHLPPPDDPVRVISLTPEIPSNVFELHDGVGIAACIRIIASSPITLAGYRLTADWLAAPLAWVPPCAEHAGKYCLARESERHLSFSPALNDRTFTRGRLKAQQFLLGFLVGKVANPLRSSAVALSATLWIRDVFGQEFPYEINLKNLPGSYSQ